MKNIYYRYNAETDNFERVYPSLKEQLLSWGKTGLTALVMAIFIFLVVFYFFDSPTLENLRAENLELRTEYGILNKRLENSMKIIGHIRERDDNFYRVMMQMEPMSETQRLSGLDNEARYRQIRNMSDASLVNRLTQNMDLLERELYAQVQSFDQLRQSLSQQEDRLAHIPAVLPIRMNEFSLSSGFGYRRDPVYGFTKFHEGLDLTSSIGTEVRATGDGVVTVSRREAGYGNCIDIDHGYNYLSRYAHLSELLVKEGETVKRGQVIGRVGSSGKSIGPHLHYEVRLKNEPQNPVNYYYMDLTPEQYSDMIRRAENAGRVMD